MIYPINHLLQTIPVGVQTEKGVEVIGFDLKPWLDVFPDMSFTVWATRPGEKEAYPVNDQMMVGTVLYWHPDGYDTAISGAGRVEIAGVGENQRKASGFVDTAIRATSLGTTKEPGESVAPWYESVLKAAQEIKADVDVGDGGLFLVTAFVPEGGRVPYADRTQEEIRAAVETGKTCVLVYIDGRVFTYYGELRLEQPPYGDCPTFIAPGNYNSGEGIEYWRVQVLASGAVQCNGYKPAKTPNPYSLTIKQGDTTKTYNGSNQVTVEIPDGVPDPGKAHQHLVSDEDGKAVWQQRLFWMDTKTQTYAENLTMTNAGEEDGVPIYIYPGTIDPIPQGGTVCKVIYNSVEFDCKATPVEEDGSSLIALGNLARLGISDAGADLPFAMVFIPPEIADGLYSMMVMAFDNAETVTVTVTGEVITVKKIPEELLPDTSKRITLTIAEDGTVTSDAAFQEAWAMTDAQLQSAITVKTTESYGGASYTASHSVDGIARRNLQSGDGYLQALQIRFQKQLDTDISNLNAQIVYIAWGRMKTDGMDDMSETIAVDTGASMYTLPNMRKNDEYKGYYLRYDGTAWKGVSLAELKADLGLT